MTYVPVTAFRRALDATQIERLSVSSDTAQRTVNKWEIIRELIAGRAAFGLDDRTLTVLEALLSFHPGAVLGGNQGPPVVHPSNNSICERLKGMASSTMRRHLARLVQLGLVLRRDSPNGKRYVRRARAGDADRGAGGAIVFGFDLSPLIARQAEICAAAEAARAQADALSRLRETVSLMRRDLLGLAEYGATLRPGLGLWDQLADLAALTARLLRRKPDAALLKAQRDSLEQALDHVRNLIEPTSSTKDISTNPHHFGQHYQNSKTDSYDLEPCLEQARAAADADHETATDAAPSHSPTFSGAPNRDDAFKPHLSPAPTAPNQVCANALIKNDESSPQRRLPLPADQRAASTNGNVATEPNRPFNPTSARFTHVTGDEAAELDHSRNPSHGLSDFPQNHKALKPNDPLSPHHGPSSSTNGDEASKLHLSPTPPAMRAADTLHGPDHSQGGMTVDDLPPSSPSPGTASADMPDRSNNLINHHFCRVPDTPSWNMAATPPHASEASSALMPPPDMGCAIPPSSVASASHPQPSDRRPTTIPTAHLPAPDISIHDAARRNDPFADSASPDDTSPLPRIPLGLVLASCPDIQAYSTVPIRHWHQLVAAANAVRPMMGISPSAWDDARAAMGPEQAAVVLAAILEQFTNIHSPGGYLRALTTKANAGTFTCGPMIMALMRKST